MSYYTDDYKFVKQYLQWEFSDCDIEKIMEWVEDYPSEINIEVEDDKWIRGDEDLMDYIQLKLIPIS